MKKKIFGLVLGFALLMSTSAFAIENNIGVEVDDVAVEFTENTGAPFIDSNSRTQVPLRVTMESFGANVGWNQETQTAIVEKDNIKVEVPIGKLYILKDGEEIATDTVAVIKNNKTYLPIRAVVEAFGAAVKWSNPYQTVLIRNDVKDADTGWFVAKYGVESHEDYLNVNTKEIYYDKSDQLVVVSHYLNSFKYDLTTFNNVSVVVQNSDFKPITEKNKFDNIFKGITLKPNEDMFIKYIFPKSSIIDDDYDLTYNTVVYYVELAEN